MRTAPYARRIWLPVAIVVVWEALARANVIDLLFFPPPSDWLARAVTLWRSGELALHVGATLVRTLTGGAIGITAGVVFGMLMGISLRVRESTESLISALVSTPKLSLLPLVMLVMGLGEAPRLALVAAASFVVAALQMVDAIRGIDAGYLELARNYGASHAQIVRWVYWPGALPHLLTGIRLALGRALGVAISIEIVNAPQGIGQMIWTGWESFQPEHIYLGIMLAIGLGMLFHAGLQTVERRLTPWNR